jgi:hypothetical protein
MNEALAFDALHRIDRARQRIASSVSRAAFSSVNIGTVKVVAMVERKPIWVFL